MLIITLREVITEGEKEEEFTIEREGCDKGREMLIKTLREVITEGEKDRAEGEFTIEREGCEKC